MIIYRAFQREAVRTTLAITAVLLAVFLFLTLTLLLGRAARGEYPDAVMQLLGLQMLRRLDLLLPLALYLGILLTLSRWYRDSEMTVLAACGVGLPGLVRPVMILGLVFAVAVGGLAFYLSPMANRHIERVKNAGTQRPVLSGIAPGVFTDFSSRQLIVYAEHVVPATGVLQRVFISRTRDRDQGVILARSGTPYRDPNTGDKFLALREGTLYEGRPGQADYQILEFATYSIRIEPKALDEPPVRIDGTPTSVLWRQSDRDSVAEWHWRLSRPVITLVLVVFAVALAYTDARRGRLSNLFVAILVYFVYSNLLVLGQTLLNNGQVPSMVGLWWVHASLALVAAYLVARRVQNKPVLTLPRLARKSP